MRSIRQSCCADCNFCTCCTTGCDRYFRSVNFINFITILCVYFILPVCVCTSSSGTGTRDNNNNFNNLPINRNIPIPSVWSNNNNNDPVFLNSYSSDHSFTYDPTQWNMDQEIINWEEEEGQLFKPLKKFKQKLIRGGGGAKDKNRWTSISPKQDIHAHPKKPLPRVPGLPNDIPLPTVNITNVITLIELAANDTEIDDPTEALLVQTLSELATAIGLQDVRDFLGMFLMYFIMGPILIPMFWMPIAVLAMLLLMIPLVLTSPFNGAAAGGRSSDNYFNNYYHIGMQEKRNFNGNSVVMNSSGYPYWESQCLEMFSCEVNNILRGSRWSSWISRTFNLTKVEWAAAKAKRKNRRRSNGGGSTETFFKHDDCSKYKCVLVKPVQRFFGNWYTYLFTYQQHKSR